MSATVGGRPLDASRLPSAADPDSILVERARRGDIEAYEELVRRYQNLAFRTAYLIVGGAAEAEDAAQEAFVKAWAALGRFRPDAPLRPWLLRIVANEARNRRAATRRRPTLSLETVEAVDQDEGHPSDDPARSPEAAALAAERRRELLAAIETLREEDRTVIAFRYFLDLSEAEMAEALGCARGTVKSRLSRALDRLRHHPSLARRDQGSSPTEAADD